MHLNKDIIIRIAVGFIFFIIFVKVVAPVIFEVLKNKIPGRYNPENDIDGLIKRQKERLRSQYGIIGRDNDTSIPLKSNKDEA